MRLFSNAFTVISSLVVKMDIFEAAVCSVWPDYFLSARVWMWPMWPKGYDFTKCLNTILCVQTLDVCWQDRFTVVTGLNCGALQPGHWWSHVKRNLLYMVMREKNSVQIVNKRWLSVWPPFTVIFFHFPVGTYFLWECLIDFVPMNNRESISAILKVQVHKWRITWDIPYLETLTQQCAFLCGAATSDQSPLDCVIGRLF